jgi:hypothetical protein
VVEHTEGVRVIKAKPKTGAIEQRVLRALEDAVGLGDSAAVGDVVDAAKNQMPFDPAVEKRDTRAQRILRALETLQAAHKVAIDGGRVRLLEGA